MSERPVQQVDATDWTAYYKKPFFLSRATRFLGVQRLIRSLRENGVTRGARFLELGGGNSCIYTAIRREFMPQQYTVVDLNDLGLKLFREAYPYVEAQTACRDLLLESPPGGPYDVVLSIGLIEHFDRAGTRTLIRRHFEAARQGALIVITYPTPTAMYRLARRVAEGLGMWRFPDERPLQVSEVTATCNDLGEVVRSWVGRWTPFTQAVVIARKV